MYDDHGASALEALLADLPGSADDDGAMDCEDEGADEEADEEADPEVADAEVADPDAADGAEADPDAEADEADPDAAVEDPDALIEEDFGDGADMADPDGADADDADQGGADAPDVVHPDAADADVADPGGDGLSSRAAEVCARASYSRHQNTDLFVGPSTECIGVLILFLASISFYMNSVLS